MKTLVTLVFLTLLFTMSAKAQNYGVGIKAGLNVSNFQTDEDYFKARLGYLVGIYGNIKISERVGFQPELVYSVQGAASDIEDGSNINLNYITLPMMFKLYLFPALNLQLGPYIGTAVHEGNVNEDSFEGFDFGLQAGINVESKGGFNVGVRYVHGFADINRDFNQDIDTGPITFSSDLRNSMISFELGYTF